MSSASKQRLAILASGTGSNTRVLLNYFSGHPIIEVAVVVTNKATAGVMQVAEELGVPCLFIPADEWSSGQALSKVRSFRVHWIVLAGFLKLIPTPWVHAFPERIINIHPALLPKYGGKGMYGHHVHKAVSEAGETETGITIHYVNEVYDAGTVIAQYKVTIEQHADPVVIARAVQQLEHHYYPRVIDAVIRQSALPQ